MNFYSFVSLKWVGLTHDFAHEVLNNDFSGSDIKFLLLQNQASISIFLVIWTGFDKVRDWDGIEQQRLLFFGWWFFLDIEWFLWFWSWSFPKNLSIFFFVLLDADVWKLVSAELGILAFLLGFSSYLCVHFSSCSLRFNELLNAVSERSNSLKSTT